jgi:hypothetical protein
MNMESEALGIHLRLLTPDAPRAVAVNDFL